MQIDEIVLHNFGVYRGRHQIELAPKSSDRPIVLFGGLNGAGKTTLLDAIQLSLYGKRARCSSRQSTAYDEFLRRSISRGVPERHGAGIEIKFIVGEGVDSSTYEVHRTWASAGKTMREELSVYRDGSLDRVITENWDAHVEEILPLDIASLFFFDGEKIEALADPAQTASVLGTAVESLLGLGMVDRLRSDLVAFNRRLQKQNTSTAPASESALDALEDELRDLTAKRDAASIRHAEASDKVRRAQLHLDSTSEDFRHHGGDLYERRLELESQRAEAEAQRFHLNEELVDVASGSLPLLLVRDLLQRTADQIEAEDAAERAGLLGEVLEERDERLVEHLRQVGNDSVATAAAEMLTLDRKVLADRRAVERYLDVPREARDRVHHLLGGGLGEVANRAISLLERLEEATARLEDCDRELAGVPTAEAVAESLAARQSAQAAVAATEERASSTAADLEELDRRVDVATIALEKALQKAAKEEIGDDDVRRMVQHSLRVRDTLSTFREGLLASHASRIEAAVLDSFNQLLRKSELVRDLRLDPKTFSMTLYGADGVEIRPERLSAGERQLLAVAILWGLARVSGRRLPMVIDTPLGRLDSEHRRHLVERYFPHASHQVLLLSTDEEIDRDLVNCLEGSISHSYELSYDHASSSTSVTPGYFWEVADVA